MSSNNNNRFQKKVTEPEQPEAVKPQQVDADGHLFIQWQTGGVKKWGKNGITEVDLLNFIKLRLNGFQKAVPCRERALGITKVEEAILWLNTIEEIDN